MRSSTLRASASLVLFLAAGGVALADGPAATPSPATQDAKPSQPEVAPAQPDAATPAQAETKATQPEAKPAETKPAPPVAQAKPPGTAATVVNLKTIEGVMGKSVRSRTGNEDMGHIVDVLVDASGDARAAVIDFGGFLGVGSRKVAVAWKTLDFADAIQSGSVKVNLTRDQVRQAPEYKPDEPVVILEGTATVSKETAAPKPAAPAAPAAVPAPAAPAPAAPSPSPEGHNQDSPPR